MWYFIFAEVGITFEQNGHPNFPVPKCIGIGTGPRLNSVLEVAALANSSEFSSCCSSKPCSFSLTHKRTYVSKHANQNVTKISVNRMLDYKFRPLERILEKS